MKVALAAAPSVTVGVAAEIETVGRTGAGAASVRDLRSIEPPENATLTTCVPARRSPVAGPVSANVVSGTARPAAVS